MMHMTTEKYFWRETYSRGTNHSEKLTREFDSGELILGKTTGNGYLIKVKNLYK